MHKNVAPIVHKKKYIFGAFSPPPVYSGLLYFRDLQPPPAYSNLPNYLESQSSLPQNKEPLLFITLKSFHLEYLHNISKW